MHQLHTLKNKRAWLPCQASANAHKISLIVFFSYYKHFVMVNSFQQLLNWLLSGQEILDLICRCFELKWNFRINHFLFKLTTSYSKNQRPFWLHVRLKPRKKLLYVVIQRKISFKFFTKTTFISVAIPENKKFDVKKIVLRCISV